MIAYNRECVREIDFISREERKNHVLNRVAFRTALLSLALAGLLVPYRLTAQEPANKPETMAPAAAQPTPAAVPATEAQKAKAREEQLKNDWPWLGRFKEADLALAPPAAGE